MIQRIDQLEGMPTVGEDYLAWCIDCHDGGVLPVLPPAHTDPFFPDVPRHWHYDVRFMDDVEVRRTVDYRTYGWTIEQIVAASPQYIRHALDTDVPKLCRRTCRRQMPVFPSTFVSPYGKPYAYRQLADLERCFAGVKLKPGCRTCPHRGISLAGLPAVDGVVTCPGHGLAWRVGTGELVSRTERVVPNEPTPLEDRS